MRRAKAKCRDERGFHSGKSRCDREAILAAVEAMKLSEHEKVTFVDSEVGHKNGG